jgi:flagellar motor switch protein FliG
MGDRHAALRWVAIVVASLDRDGADQLLERLPDAQAEVVRNAILSLDDLQPDEEAEVIEGFLQDRLPACETDDPQPVDALLRDVPEDERPRIDDPPAESAPPWQALSDEQLADFLQHERAATIAVILHRVDFERAASIVNLLPCQQQAPVLRALSKAGVPGAGVLDAVQSELSVYAARLRVSASENESRVARVRSLLSKIDQPSRQAMLSQLAGGDLILARRLGWQPPVAAPDTDDQPAAETPGAPPGPVTDEPSSGPASFDDLLHLSDDLLAASLRAVSPEVAVLALTDASDRMLQRLQKHLSPEQRRELRRRLHLPSPFVLSDLQLAQQAVVDAARTLCQATPSPGPTDQ